MSRDRLNFTLNEGGVFSTPSSIGEPAWEYQLQVDTEIGVEVLKGTTRFADIYFERISADRLNPLYC